MLTQVTQVPFFGLNALLPATSTHPFGNSQILSRSVSTPLQRELLGMDQTNDTEPAPACCKDMELLGCHTAQAEEQGPRGKQEHLAVLRRRNRLEAGSARVGSSVFAESVLFISI